MNLQTVNPYIRFARMKEITIPHGLSGAVDHRIFYCHSGSKILFKFNPVSGGAESS